MSTLTTNTAPRQLAVSKQDVAALVDALVTETIKRLDAREQHKMIANAVRDGMTRHLEQQRNAAKVEPEDIFANYTIEGDAATYMNSLLEQK